MCYNIYRNKGETLENRKDLIYMARKIYRYTFADGYVCWAHFSRDELAIEVYKHGKLIRKIAE